MLIGQIIKRAKARGFKEMTVWVLDFNARARAFYEGRGFALDERSRMDDRTGISLVERRYRMTLREES